MITGEKERRQCLEKGRIRKDVIRGYGTKGGERTESGGKQGGGEKEKKSGVVEVEGSNKKNLTRVKVN